MAVINQDGINSLVKAINNANTNFSNTMKSGASDFSTTTASIWESANAVKFARNFKTDLDNIASSYKKTVDSIYSVLNTNVTNHNKRNGGSVSVPGLDYTIPDTSSLTTNIKAKFANGDEGIKEGADISSVKTKYNTAMAKISEALNDAVTAAANSKAFGDDEISYFRNAYAKVKRAFDSANEQEGTALTNFLNAEKEADTNLASTNKSNLGN